MARPEGLIVITGPTASGKTRLVFELSRNHDIEVISADSMQVYRHMDIATAKPYPEQLASLPHHLIDVVDPDEEFHAAMFTALAQEKIREVKARGKIPVVAGGTGLYIKALIYGLAPAPARAEHVRKALRSIIARRGMAYLESMLQRLDPDAASVIRKNDAVRIIRSLEIIFLTGYKTSSVHAGHGFHKPFYHTKIASIMPERDLLFRNIDERTMKMVEHGLLDETRRLLDMGYGPGLRSMQALAYKHVISHLNSEKTLDEAVRLIQRDTRRYAKRQITWMKGRADHVFFDSVEKALESVSSWLDR
ncbi:MAG TPA: tRNA (adenosine(37)-N6)-dimethylallyltransferase MiaA [Desulfomonilia bacterium]|nr:tRNA (adenosine(37)-N6)-dimethylallyltransferase MiaA [Desulfomonilia bacterium]